MSDEMSRSGRARLLWLLAIVGVLLALATWLVLRDSREAGPAPSEGEAASAQASGGAPTVLRRQRVRTAPGNAASEAGADLPPERDDLAAELTVRARVRRANGDTIPGAEVRILRGESFGYRRGADAVLVAGTTDEDGMVTLRYPSAQKVWIAAWFGSAEAAVTRQIVVHPSHVREIELTLHPAYVLTGIVRDANGRRLSGVPVVAIDFGEGELSGGTRRAVTGDEGRFRFPPQPVTSRPAAEIRVRYPGFATWADSRDVYAGEVSEIDIDLVPSLQLRVRGVDPDGEPVVAFAVASGRGAAMELGTADQQGRFAKTLDGIKVESPIILRARGYALVARDVPRERDGVLDLGTITFDRGAKITGSVLASSGSTGRFRVSLRTSEHHVPVEGRWAARDGSFVFDNVAPEPHDILVQPKAPEGELGFALPRVVGRARGGDTEVNVAVPVAPRLGLRFVDAATGEALPINATRVLVSAAADEGFSVGDLWVRVPRSDAWVEVPQSGSFDITVSVAGFETVRLQGVEIVGAAQSLDVRLREQGN